jgi:hypothetical protein
MKTPRSSSKGALTLIVAALCFLVACAGRAPYEDYTLAHVALSAAKAAQAPRLAPGNYARAEDFYHRGVHFYEDRDFNAARTAFVQARYYAEQSENYTVLKKAETGETN